MAVSGPEPDPMTPGILQNGLRILQQQPIRRFPEEWVYAPSFSFGRPVQPAPARA